MTALTETGGGRVTLNLIHKFMLQMLQLDHKVWVRVRVRVSDRVRVRVRVRARVRIGVGRASTIISTVKLKNTT